MSFLEKLDQCLNEKEERMIALRRHFHEYPELSFKEKETSQYIADFYKDLDCEVKTQVGNGYGLTVTIASGRPGKTLALRADFDALPIQEEVDVPFKSKHDGVMHACGHDGHTAYMMILAETLIELREEWSGKVVILHQNAEEVTPGGAKSMIADGALDGVDAVIGAHVMSNMPVGTVSYCPGNCQTGRSNFTLKIQGSGGHASSPHQAKDAIVAGAYFVTEAQSIVSRVLNPFAVGTVTIGNFDGHGAKNAINGEVTLGGDVRTMDEESRQKIEEAIRARVQGLQDSFGVQCDLAYDNNYPVLHNDDDLLDLVLESLNSHDFKELTAVQQVGPQNPSEDFAYYAKERPAVFLWIGATDPDHLDKAYPHHHPKFFMDERALLIAAKTVGRVVDRYLND